MNDSLVIDDYTYYAGIGDDNPVVFRMKNNDCGHFESIIAPSLKRSEGFEYDEFSRLGDRVTVQYFRRSAGVNSSQAFLLSLDRGETWTRIDTESIDMRAEGVRTLKLKGDTEIILTFYSLEKPNSYHSLDNGTSWKVYQYEER